MSSVRSSQIFATSQREFQIESSSPDVPQTKWDVPKDTLHSRLRRYALAVAWSVKPPRLQTLPTLGWLLAKNFLTKKNARTLPDANAAYIKDGGLCGIVADASAEGIFAGFQKGLYPMGHIPPFKWWSPPVRSFLVPENLRIEKNLARRLRNSGYRFTLDEAPLEVLKLCAAPRNGRVPLTWITPEMMRLALELFDRGIMHTVEVWNPDGELVGGLYGYSVGRIFSIESQFHSERDTSKMATVALMAHLQKWDYLAADGKRMTGHLKSLGFEAVPREDLQKCFVGKTSEPSGRWQFDGDFDLGRWKSGTVCPQNKPADVSA